MELFISNIKLIVILLSLVIVTPIFADFKKARELVEQEKFSEAKSELLEVVRAARAGDAEAQLEFGLMLDTGYWLIKNTKEAVEWWRKSAEQGNTKAQMLMGSAYLGGIKIAKNLKESNKWFDKAIESDGTLVEVVDSVKAWAAEVEADKKQLGQ